MRLPSANFRSPAALARFVLVTVIGLAIDQWTKVAAFNKLEDRPEGYPFIPGWVHFQITRNHGAVFGLGQGNRWLFVAVSVAAIVFIALLFANSGRQRFYQFVLGLLLSGVLGNMYDRVALGYVRDMIHIFPGVKWPTAVAAAMPSVTLFRDDIFPWIFNVADSMLCVGVGLMILYSFLHAPETRPGAAFAVTKPQAEGN